MKASPLVWMVALHLFCAAFPLHAQPSSADPKLFGTPPTLALQGATEAEVPNVATSKIEEIRIKATSGDAVAQVQLGLSYWSDQSAATNSAEAVKWYRMAAEQGNPMGQVCLGLAYYNGWGVPRNYVEAAKLYRRAAEQGNIMGQTYLADCYEEGKGVPRDETEAAEWYRKAYTNKEQADALFLMFRLCAEQGDERAQWALGFAYFHGYGVQQDYFEAARWFRKAGDRGIPEAQLFLGKCYVHGYGVSKDSGEALRWYRMAAENGQAEAQVLLGMAYAQTLLSQPLPRLERVPQDYIQAVKWFRRAANQGDAGGQFSLGACYWEGRGVPMNRVEAYKWFNLAAAQSGEGVAKKLAVEGAAVARKGLATAMTSGEIAEAQRLSAVFVPRKEAQATGSFEPVGRIIWDDEIEKAQRPKGKGTGFFITEDGFLVTNEHVIKNAAQVRLITNNGTIDAKVLRVDAANDLALLKSEGEFTPLPIAPSRTVRLGNTIATVGFPNVGLQGFAPKFAKGEVASISGAQDDPRYFQISVPVQPGNSGGALVDERGNVVGVVSAKLNASAALSTSGAFPENVNYAVKSSFLLSFLESVPEVTARLKEPNTRDRRFEDVVKSAEQAAVLVLVY